MICPPCRDCSDRRLALFEHVFDTCRVTVFADPPPWWDEAPEPEPDCGFGDWRWAEHAFPDDDLPDPDDRFLDLDVPADTDPRDDGEGSGWAVPGLGADHGGREGLSRASVAALHEAAASWEALRLAQARCYRALSGLHAGDAVAQSGYRSMPRLLADHLRVDDEETRRLHRHARSLTPTLSPTGTPIPAQLPATAEHVRAGVIGPGHVEVIRTTMTRLGKVPGLDPDTLATTETQLAELATTHTPSALAHAATAICALLDPDGAAPDDDPPPDNELHYLRRRDGSLAGKFVYRDPAAAELLHTALNAATPPDEAAALHDLDDRDTATRAGSTRAGRTPAGRTPVSGYGPGPTPAPTPHGPCPPAAPRACSTSPPKPSPAASTSTTPPPTTRPANRPRRARPRRRRRPATQTPTSPRGPAHRRTRDTDARRAHRPRRAARRRRAARPHRGDPRPKAGNGSRCT